MIEGHCANEGSDAYTMALAQRRAEAIRSYLNELGVPNEQMRIVSLGRSSPAVQGDEKDVAALNRRAEIRQQ